MYLKGGEHDEEGVLKEILEWDPASGTWKNIGALKIARITHAVSLVKWNDVKMFCT